MVERQRWLFEATFSRSAKLRQADHRISDNAGALLLREVDHRLALTADPAVKLAVWDRPGLSPRKTRSRRSHKDLRRVATGGIFCYPGLMNTIIDLFRNLWKSIGCIGELLGYLLRSVSATTSGL
jgi:hypothetical protein